MQEAAQVLLLQVIQVVAQAVQVVVVTVQLETLQAQHMVEELTELKCLVLAAAVHNKVRVQTAVQA
jgi:hypothetical protein